MQKAEPPRATLFHAEGLVEYLSLEVLDPPAHDEEKEASIEVHLVHPENAALRDILVCSPKHEAEDRIDSSENEPFAVYEDSEEARHENANDVVVYCIYEFIELVDLRVS